MSDRTWATGFGLAALLAVCVSATAAEAQKKSPPPPSVIVQKVVQKDVTPTYRFVGRIVAVDTVDIRARVEGILQSRDFIEGRFVKKGQRLFLIEKAPYEVIVEQRLAELASAEATQTHAKADFKRKLTLQRRAVVSDALVDQSRAAMLTADAEVLKAKAELRAARLDLGYTEIKSPITGRISLAKYSIGNLVGSSSEPLATITSVDPVYVTFGVSEKQMIAVRKRGIDLNNPPMAPTLMLSDGSPYDQTGKFNYLSPNVNKSTDTIVARAAFPNPKGVLLPGQFVSVIVRPKKTERAIVVPQVAVQSDAKGYFVLVVDRENKVEVRRIQAVRQIENEWVVSHGLATGERIITEGIQKVRPDMVVTPVAPTNS